jgi:hypothetical protein
MVMGADEVGLPKRSRQPCGCCLLPQTQLCRMSLLSSVWDEKKAHPDPSYFRKIVHVRLYSQFYCAALRQCSDSCLSLVVVVGRTIQ